MLAHIRSSDSEPLTALGIGQHANFSAIRDGAFPLIRHGYPRWPPLLGRMRSCETFIRYVLRDLDVEEGACCCLPSTSVSSGLPDTTLLGITILIAFAGG